MSTRTVTALFLVQMAAGSLIAQDGSEFSRTSGGQVEALSKRATQKLSGSLGMSILGSSSGKGYQATLGGTIVEDRLWFFASAQQQERAWFASALPQMAQPVDVDATFGKVNAQIGDRQSLFASLGTTRETSPMMPGGSIPSSFLTLRYTGTVSSNMFVSASFISQRR